MGSARKSGGVRSAAASSGSGRKLKNEAKEDPNRVTEHTGTRPNRSEPNSTERSAMLASGLRSARGDEGGSEGLVAEAGAVAGLATVTTDSTNVDATAATPATAANESQPSPGGKRKRACDDIDAIFDLAKQEKSQAATGSGQKGKETKGGAKDRAKGKVSGKKGKKVESGGGGGGMGDESKARKRTQEGYRVYKEEELAWNKKNAGGTPQCPFDCDCCF